MFSCLVTIFTFATTFTHATLTFLQLASAFVPHTLLLFSQVLPSRFCTLLLPLRLYTLLLLSLVLLPLRVLLLLCFVPCYYFCTCCYFCAYCYLHVYCFHALLLPLHLVLCALCLSRYSFPNFLCKWKSLEQSASLSQGQGKKNSLVLRFIYLFIYFSLCFFFVRRTCFVLDLFDLCNAFVFKIESMFLFDYVQD